MNGKPQLIREDSKYIELLEDESAFKLNYNVNNHDQCVRSYQEHPPSSRKVVVI